MALKDGEATWQRNRRLRVCNEIYDFKLINKDSSHSNPYVFTALIKDGNYIKLLGTKIGFENNNGIGRESDSTKSLIQFKNFTKAYYNNDTTDFYYITYNNFSDFSSGYSLIPPSTTDYSINNVTFNNNAKSPFEF